MAKFVYRMQNILNIKQKLETQAKMTYSLANQKYLEQQKILQEYMVRRWMMRICMKQENLTSTEPGLSCIPTENILLWGKNSANLDTAYRKRKNDTRLIAAACPSVQHIHLHFSFSSYCRWLLPVLL